MGFFCWGKKKIYIYIKKKKNFNFFLKIKSWQTTSLRSFLLECKHKLRIKLVGLVDIIDFGLIVLILVDVNDFWLVPVNLVDINDFGLIPLIVVDIRDFG